MVKKEKQSKLQTGVIIYFTLIGIWLISWLVVGDANWFLTLLNRIVPFLFIPAPVLLVWVAFVRRLKLIIPLMVPVFIFASLYHPYLFPKLTKPTTEDPELKIMTYNVLFSNSNYEAVAGVILDYLPDLVALQEVQPEMMNELIVRLHDEYPYHLMGTTNDYGTTAVFSKHSLIEFYVLDLQADRPAVVVRTKVNNKEITFVAVHLLAYNLWWTKLPDIPEVVMQRTASQNRQARIVIDEISKEHGIVIVGCDCNSYETTSSYRIFGKFMNNAARQTGWFLSESELPGTQQDRYLQHIDYVWYDGYVTAKSVYKIQDNGGSDHFPVLAIFDMK
ncbi:MAG: endonuclease/exonuclease/phosphatase family protein [Chloroflexota bacterium]